MFHVSQFKIIIMKTFNDLEFKDNFEHKLKTISYNKQAVCIFDNGYGCSVIIGKFTYGGKDELYALAVLDNKGKFCYDTPVTNGLIGWLTSEQITKKMKEIQLLPSLLVESN